LTAPKEDIILGVRISVKEVICLRIGDIAQRLGVSPFFIRSLEKEGLIHPRRSPTGQRVFDEADLGLISEILKGRWQSKQGRKERKEVDDD
jgi:hypothetical protein